MSNNKNPTVTAAANNIKGGGVLIDSRDPNNVFKTINKQEWLEHCKETKVTKTGTEPCQFCKVAIVEFKDFPEGQIVLCENCKTEVKKSIV